MTRPVLGPDTRLMVWSPHPDDETLGCGLSIQTTLRVGGRVRIVFLTDGDNNPWPQRWVEHRWRIGEGDRKRWGNRRRREAQRAAAALGVRREATVFLGFPDQGLTGLLTAADPRLVSAAAGELHRWQPTILLTPAMDDLHPDHNAASVLARVAIRQAFRQGAGPTHLEYLVHGSATRPAVWRLDDPDLRRVKLRALRHHRSQLALRRKTLEAVTGRPEQIARACAAAENPGRGIVLPLSPRPGAFGPVRVVVLERLPDGRHRSWDFAVPLGRGKRVHGPDDTVWTARRSLHRLRLESRAPGFDRRSTLFVKVHRKFGFFDETGWRVFERPPT